MVDACCSGGLMGTAFSSVTSSGGPNSHPNTWPLHGLCHLPLATDPLALQPALALPPWGLEPAWDGAQTQ